ncbi:hypothetical protein TRFO_21254 [Tritrichomonas foetus]|uniref:Uncharacterized protein n=1 Tax=Tritrichomonas foetus TaxID=1144522 RepID=A0A1J4KEY5_9EUKA|nr:hypothetical protein TRFO_21254 [Tritrichomonas foetus]|eukprot:OHT09739.1 hypothetical protein TRFO_21254 [Tritrichomonas foetus]
MTRVFFLKKFVISFMTILNIKNMNININALYREELGYKKHVFPNVPRFQSCFTLDNPYYDLSLSLSGTDKPPPNRLFHKLSFRAKDNQNLSFAICEKNNNFHHMSISFKEHQLTFLPKKLITTFLIYDKEGKIFFTRQFGHHPSVSCLFTSKPIQINTTIKSKIVSLDYKIHPCDFFTMFNSFEIVNNDPHILMTGVSLEINNDLTVRGTIGIEGNALMASTKCRYKGHSLNAIARSEMNPDFTIYNYNQMIYAYTKNRENGENDESKIENGLQTRLNQDSKDEFTFIYSKKRISMLKRFTLKENLCFGLGFMAQYHQKCSIGFEPVFEFLYKFRQGD